MVDCAKCGTKLGFFDSQKYWNIWLKKGYLDFGKVLLTKTKHSIELPELKGKNLCLDCAIGIYFGKQFKEALDQGRRQVIIEDVVRTGINDMGKHLESVSTVAQEYGYILKQETHTLSNLGFGVIVVVLTMIFEKIVTHANETNFVNCAHCTIRYDANQYFKCPQCGAPAT